MKNNLFALFLFLFAMAPLNEAAAYDQPAGDWIRINTNGTWSTATESGTLPTMIHKHGTCKEVESYSGPLDLFVGLKTGPGTPSEWTSFWDYGTPPGVVIDVCWPLYCYADADGDGYGDQNDTTVNTVYAYTCPTGEIDNNNDCDDSRSDLTTDCSQTICYTDSDSDAYRASDAEASRYYNALASSCPAGQTSNTTNPIDCHDGNSSLTTDCSQTTCYYDGDGDGFRLSTTVSSTYYNALASSCPSGQTSSTTTDCDDAYYDTTNSCTTVACHTDSDGDGWGAAFVANRYSCGAGEVSQITDCDDAYYDTSNTCPKITCYTDADGDGYTVGTGTLRYSCNTGETSTSSGTDCDDTDSTKTTTCTVDPCAVENESATRVNLYSVAHESPLCPMNRTEYDTWREMNAITSLYVPDNTPDVTFVSGKIKADGSMTTDCFRSYTSSTGTTKTGIGSWLLSDISVQTNANGDPIPHVINVGSDGSFYVEKCSYTPPSSVTCYTDADGDGWTVGSGTVKTSCGTGETQTQKATDCDDSAFSSDNTCTASCNQKEGGLADGTHCCKTVTTVDPPDCSQCCNAPLSYHPCDPGMGNICDGVQEGFCGQAHEGMMCVQ